jgi:uncharacterized YigZ family protein
MAVYTIAATVQAEIEIRKSRFIGFIIPVEDRIAAMHELNRLREEYNTATHVCWALMAGGQSGMSDDGEPSGTAGRPMLEVLRHHNLEGVLAAVVRYYGGIQLGAGGLVRAYTDAVATALQHAQLTLRVSFTQLEIECDYADEARLRRWVEQQDYVLVQGIHNETVRLLIRLPEVQAAAASKSVLNLTQGRARLHGNHVHEKN